MSGVSRVSTPHGWTQRPSYLLLCTAAMIVCVPGGLRTAIGSDDDSRGRALWIGRLRAQIDQLPEGDRAVAVVALADAGQVQEAKDLVSSRLPESERPSAIMFIAAAQSAQGDVAGALETLDALPEESPLRDSGRALVAIRQAQRGELAQAQRLIEGVESQSWLDRARNAIASGQARARDQQSALATADLIRDAYLRRQAQSAIAATDKEGFFSAEEIPSRFLSGQIHALALFSSDSSWKTAAVSTLGAAYRKDCNALASGAEKCLAALEGVPEGLDRATGCAILALAFSEAGDAANAEKLGSEAVKAMSADPLGVSALFGRPIVMYAMIRLGHYEHIDTFLDTARQSEDAIKRIRDSGVFQAIGAALVEKREDRRLEEVYRRLTTPGDRAHFSIGALYGCAPPEQT